MDGHLSREDLSRDLFPLLGVSAVFVGVAVLTPGISDSVIRIVVTAAFLLFVPGYALVAALFPRGDDITLLERVTFSVGASIALGTLVGLPLNQLAVGIQLWTLAIVNFGLGLFLMGVAEYRRSRLDDDERAAPYEELSVLVGRSWGRRNVVGGGSKVVQALIVGSLLLSVGATAYVVATPLPSETYTELYVLGTDGTVEGLPENVSAGEPVGFEVGVVNTEHERINYGLQIQRKTDSGTEVLWTGRQSLAHRDSWSRNFSYQMPNTETATYEILLFREPPPDSVVEPRTAYRETHIQVWQRGNTTR